MGWHSNAKGELRPGRDCLTRAVLGDIILVVVFLVRKKIRGYDQVFGLEDNDDDGRLIWWVRLSGDNFDSLFEFSSQSLGNEAVELEFRPADKSRSTTGLEQTDDQGMLHDFGIVVHQIEHLQHYFEAAWLLRGARSTTVWPAQRATLVDVDERRLPTDSACNSRAGLGEPRNEAVDSSGSGRRASKVEVRVSRAPRPIYYNQQRKTFGRFFCSLWTLFVVLYSVVYSVDCHRLDYSYEKILQTRFYETTLRNISFNFVQNNDNTDVLIHRQVYCKQKLFLTARASETPPLQYFDLLVSRTQQQKAVPYSLTTSYVFRKMQEVNINSECIKVKCYQTVWLNQFHFIGDGCYLP